MGVTAKRKTKTRNREDSNEAGDSGDNIGDFVEPGKATSRKALGKAPKVKARSDGFEQQPRAKSRAKQRKSKRRMTNSTT